MITARAGLRYPVLSDTADVPRDVGNLASDTDSKFLIWSSGTTALRPASAISGRTYYATDGDRLSYDQGATWRQIMIVTSDGKMTSDATITAPGYQVSGVALAASHLSNGVTGSGAVVLAASPTMSGTPLAPTPTAGDNSTKVATTAFVTAAVGSATAGAASVPIGGSIEWDYAAADIPTWSLLQYGQAVLRATYAALNTLAGNAAYPHGNGDGATTFNIADKRGRVSAGKDDMGGVAASRITAAISGTAGTVLGAAVGAEGVTLTTATIPSHNHGNGTLATGNDTPDHTHSFGSQSGGPTSGNPGPNWFDGTSSTAGANTRHTHTITGAIANAGSGGAHLNTQPTIIVNKIVRAL